MFASLRAVVAGNAFYAAALRVRAKVLDHAAYVLEAAPEDLELEGGKVFVRGVPTRSVTLGALAVRANPLRGGGRAWNRARARGDFLLRSLRATPPRAACTPCPRGRRRDHGGGGDALRRHPRLRACPQPAHPRRSDPGRGGARASATRSTSSSTRRTGALLNATFMDYLLPGATEVPDTGGHLETLSPVNPLGVEGEGEAGAIPVERFRAGDRRRARDRRVGDPRDPARPESIVRARH